MNASEFDMVPRSQGSPGGEHCAVVSPEQREGVQEEGSDGQEEGQDSPIACGDDIHLYDNQISPGPGQYAPRGGLGTDG